MEDLQVSVDDIESLAEKLDALTPSLNEREQAVLAAVIRSAAAAADDEVVGFALSAFGSPLSSALGRAINFGPDGAVIAGHGVGGPGLDPGGLRGKVSPNKPQGF